MAKFGASVDQQESNVISFNLIPESGHGGNGDVSDTKAPATPTKFDFSNFKILIVDDEEDLRDAISYDFKRKKFQVFTAASGVDALELMKQHRFNLIVSDVRMPNGDGMFLLEKAKLLEPTLPIIFITGFSEHSETGLLAKGAAKVFPKTYDRAELMAFVSSTLLPLSS